MQSKSVADAGHGGRHFFVAFLWRLGGAGVPLMLVFGKYLKFEILKLRIILHVRVMSIESAEHKRYTIFPITHWREWKLYHTARSLVWFEEEIDLELVKDPADWATLDPAIKNFIEHILAFFAVSDGVVNETLTEQILDRVHPPEIKFWYHFQVMMEDVHNIVYSKLIDTYIKDAAHKERLFNAITHYPTIQKKINWVHRWLGKYNEIQTLSDDLRQALNTLVGEHQAMRRMCRETGAQAARETPGLERLIEQLREERPSLGHQILINTIMEGIFFTGSFCAIFWVYHQYGKLPGLSKANEFISRDEGLHTEFGIHIYRNRIVNKLPQSEVFKIIDEAVDIESEFIASALPIGLVNMNAQLMLQYIQFTADWLLVELGYSRRYKAENPFAFMKKQSISVRMGDFFIDGNISEYGHFAAGTTVEDNEFDTSDY
jgi:ribonucleoside-diphosphate reductase beta chain